MRLVCCVLVLLMSSVPGFAGQEVGAPAPASVADEGLPAAQTKLEHGDTAGAMAILDRMRREQPGTKGLAHELGLVFYRSGKLVDAEAAFAQAMKEDAGDKESVQLRGLTLYRLGQPGAAIPYLEQVREWTSNGNADANYVLGLCYLNARRYDEARAAFAVQYGVARDSGAAYLLMANMLLQANLPELALVAGQKAVAVSPSLPLAHFMLGQVLLFKSDVNAALAEFLREQEMNPGYAPTYDRLGDVYTRAGRLQEAQEALTRALSLDRSSTGPFIQMGKVYLKKNDPQTAAMYLQHAEKMDAGNPITHTLLGQAYRGMGRAEEAKRELELASKIHASGELKLQPVQ